MTLPNNETLDAIILRAQGGDKAAFALLYQEYVTPVYRYVFVRTRNSQDTEDIVQDTFLKVYQALPRYTHERESMLPYLFTIARNLLINHGKKKRPDTYLPEEIDRYAGGESTSKMSSDKELAHLLDNAMDVLTETEREVIELRFFGEQTYTEIAEVLDKREDAIRQHVARAMKKMKEALGDLDSDTPRHLSS